MLKDLWIRTPLIASSPGGPLEGTLFAASLESRDQPGAGGNRSMLVQSGLAITRARLNRQLLTQGYALVRETGSKRGGRATVVLEYDRRGEQLVAWLGEVDPVTTAVTQTWTREERSVPVRPASQVGEDGR